MPHIIIHILEHAFLDTLKAVPLLFLAYLLIEFLEHKASDKFVSALAKPGALGPVVGAVLGSVPQCGFSVAAANFFSGRVISMGTLVAVFIATSDEALPILIAHPDQLGNLWKIILIKVVLGIVGGILVDFVFARKRRSEHRPFEELCEHCDCDEKGVFRSALHHTVHITLFILLVNVLLCTAVELIGEDSIGKIMLSGNFFQPFVTALVGFIPNCASSVILTELFIGGSISLGSLTAGLSTGAGVGLAVLFRTNRHVKENLSILAFVYALSVAAGILLNLIL